MSSPPSDVAISPIGCNSPIDNAIVLGKEILASLKKTPKDDREFEAENKEEEQKRMEEEMKMKADIAQDAEKKAREREVDAVERMVKVPRGVLFLDCFTCERKHQLIKKAWRSTDNAVVQQQQQQQQPMSPPSWSDDVAFRAEQKQPVPRWLELCQ